MDKIDFILKELKVLNKRISELEKQVIFSNFTLNTSNDPIILDVINYIKDKEKISASDLQRKFNIGYARSARIIDELLVLGYIDKNDDGKAKKTVNKGKFKKLFSNNNKNIKDPLMLKAIDIVTQVDKASASLLQRRLRIGYAKAAKLLDELEENGYVGPAIGSLPRLVLINTNGK